MQIANDKPVTKVHMRLIEHSKGYESMHSFQALLSCSNLECCNDLNIAIALHINYCIQAFSHIHLLLRDSLPLHPSHLSCALIPHILSHVQMEYMWFTNF